MMCAYCLWDPPETARSVGDEPPVGQAAEFVINGVSACPYHAELHSSPTSVAALRHKSRWNVGDA